MVTARACAPAPAPAPVFATGLDARQDDYNKVTCSPGSLINNLLK